MASIFRMGLLRLTNGSLIPKLLSGPVNVEVKLAVRGIAGSELRAIRKTPARPKPWPYHTKGYTNFNFLFDRTTARLNENSKIVVVEGPVAAGKTKLAKELAKDLDMLYLPEAHLDMFYTNEYGFNVKTLNDQMPESCRTFDVEDFLKNPRHRKTLCFQLMQYQVRFSQYIDALAHLFSTGQGVVLDRSVYSDFAFTEAMHKCGFISKKAKEFYYEVRSNTLGCLLRPHVVIYLDVPVKEVQERIKKRRLTCEKSSSVLTEKYLQTMEGAYKQAYLTEINKHAELLVYDWSEEADVEVVIEDLERIDFSWYDIQDYKMKDWAFELEEDFAVARHTYADKKDQLESFFNIFSFDLPELVTPADDYKAYIDILNDSPGNQYAYGYNATMGDKNWMIKMGLQHRETLPLIERTLK